MLYPSKKRRVKLWASSTAPKRFGTAGRDFLALTWESVEVKGGQAVATVRAARGKKDALGQLNFTKENGEWKMTPGLMAFGGPPGK